MSHTANIVVVRTDGTDRVRLTRDHDAGQPVFSPNGRRILFSGRPRKGLHWGLWVMHRDGTHKRLLADQAHDPESGSDAEYFDPDYSPDGSSIVFQRDDCRGGCALSVLVMRSDGSRIQTVSGDRAPVFSPNGNRIAAMQIRCDIDDNCDGALISFDRHGDHRRVVRDPADPFQSFGGPSWQPIPGGYRAARPPRSPATSPAQYLAPRGRVGQRHRPGVGRPGGLGVRKHLIFPALLPQPGGFEGIFRGPEELQLHQAPVPKREDGRRTELKRRAASFPTPRWSWMTTTWSSPASRISIGSKTSSSQVSE